ncbi:MAG: NAD(P)-dependent oxidoreductase [Caulobacteraceae bacterium]
MSPIQQKSKPHRVFITGAAGLVGQNIMPALVASGDYEIVGVDKHQANLAILRSFHPDIRLIEADLSEPGPWQAEAAAADSIVMLHAQIGGLDGDAFERNNVTATRRVLDAAATGAAGYLVHISSSVVNSAAEDFYTESKKAQEALVETYPIRKVILRPTLMFGWFDRKHMGWLRRFLDRTPVFPIPGNGRFLRQPLFAGDFASIITACLQSRIEGAYNISGLESVDYIDMIRTLKQVTGAHAPIVKIPYGLFHVLLSTYALVNRDPPFTTAQLKALATPDVFEVIDWPGLFGVRPTPLREAFERTYRDPRFADVTLEF